MNIVCPSCRSRGFATCNHVVPVASTPRELLDLATLRYCEIRASRDPSVQYNEVTFAEQRHVAEIMLAWIEAFKHVGVL